MFWTFGFRGRPSRPLGEVLGDLIDASSVRGGTFDLGSACFDVTRVVTGQIDAYVEPGPLLLDVPGMREQFERVGGGSVLNNSPYDLAAAALCATEAGAAVTDAPGGPPDDPPPPRSRPPFHMSHVAGANATPHHRLLHPPAARPPAAAPSMNGHNP